MLMRYSLEHLQSWILQKTGVDISQQILMTARGKQVKLQTLLQEVQLLCQAILRWY